MARWIQGEGHPWGLTPEEYEELLARKDNSPLTVESLSPERGQLLISLVHLNVDMSPLTERRATFQYADLRGANLRGANLSGIFLRESDLSRTQLEGANLKDADTYGANLRLAYLKNSDLRNIFLTGADTTTFVVGANISGTILFDVNGHWAKLFGIILDSKDDAIQFYGSKPEVKDSFFREMRFIEAEGGKVRIVYHDDEKFDEHGSRPAPPPDAATAPTPAGDAKCK